MLEYLIGARKVMHVHVGSIPVLCSQACDVMNNTPLAFHYRA